MFIHSLVIFTCLLRILVSVCVIEGNVVETVFGIGIYNGCKYNFYRKMLQISVDYERGAGKKEKGVKGREIMRIE